MSVAIDPDSAVTLSPGGSKRVYAKLMDGETISDSVGVLISAASVTGVSFGTPSLIGTSDLEFDVTVTYSNEDSKKFAGKTINGSAAYEAGKDYANSLYSTVNVTPISTAHRVTYVSITRQGAGKTPQVKVLYNNAGQAVTVYDVGSASTVYTKGSTVEYYTVGYSGTVLYEAGTQKTYYTKS